MGAATDGGAMKGSTGTLAAIHPIKENLRGKGSTLET